MADTRLEAEIRVLVEQYGRQRVLKALATVSDNTKGAPEEAPACDAVRPDRTVPRSLQESVAKACAAHPDRQLLVHRLMVAYERGRFLPRMPDVCEFLQNSRRTDVRPRTRRAARRVVVSTLAKLPPTDLQSLLDGVDCSDESDYSLLANQILGKRDTA